MLETWLATEAIFLLIGGIMFLVVLLFSGNDGGAT